MNVLVVPGSLRKDSFNRKLANLAAEHLRASGVTVDHANGRELDLPIYDGDVEKAGIPAPVRALGDRVVAADAILFSTPEYNHSIPGPLKNAFDWVSRIRPQPFKGKSTAILSASPGASGGTRGGDALRDALFACMAFVHPDTFPLGNADEAFDDAGALKDPKRSERLAKLLDAWLENTKRLHAP